MLDNSLPRRHSWYRFNAAEFLSDTYYYIFVSVVARHVIVYATKLCIVDQLIGEANFVTVEVKPTSLLFLRVLSVQITLYVSSLHSSRVVNSSHWRNATNVLRNARHKHK